MGRRPDLVLNRTVIARAALQILDDDGPAALTVRSLAHALDVKSASLYNHMSSKDEILEAVGELMGNEIDLAPLADPDWRNAIKGFARSYRKAFLNHPGALTLIAGKPVTSDAGIGGYDDVLARLQAAGMSPKLSLELMGALDSLVLGSALIPFIETFDKSSAEYELEYPALARALAASDRARVNEASFEVALDAMLRGWPVTD